MNIFSLCHLMKFIAFIFIWKVFPASENCHYRDKGHKKGPFHGAPRINVIHFKFNLLGHVHKVVVKKENY